jgi:outer membrane lipopolysaccharide assembly protein LptE/RlpB
MRRAVLLVALLTALAACGVAISGRVEVGDEVGKPMAATPCPPAIE